MKFTPGSDTDTAQCIAPKHEFLRCEDAFKEFEKYGTAMIMAAQAQEQAGLPAVMQEDRWMLSRRIMPMPASFITFTSLCWEP